MQLEHVTTLGGAVGFAEVVFDSTGPFETVTVPDYVTVATFDMPHDANVIVTMWFNAGSSTTSQYIRGFGAFPVSGDGITAQMSQTNTHYRMLSCYGELPAGQINLRVHSGSSLSSGATTPTRFRVIAWRD